MGSYLDIAREFMQEHKKLQAGVEGFETYEVGDRVVRLYRMREACQSAGHCLCLSMETDCNLYPVRPGWCRERL